MNKRTKKILKIALPIVLAGIFGWYSFAKLQIKEIVPYFENANYLWVGLGIFCGFLSHLSRAYRWKFTLEPLGYNPKLANSIMAVFIAYFANFGVPRSGEVLRAAVMANYENVPFEKGFGTIVAERIADMVVMLGIIIIALFLEFDYIYQFFAEKFNPKSLIVSLSVLVIGALFFVLYIKRSQSKFANKIREFVNGLLEGVLSIFRMKQKWAFIFHTLFIWAMYLMMFYVTSMSLIELIGIPFGAILIAFIAASFTIAISNGGLFLYPAAVLGALLLFGLPETPSYAFGWIVWTAQTLLIIFFGAWSFLLLPIYNRSK